MVQSGENAIMMVDNNKPTYPCDLEKTEESESRPWCNIHEDVLRLIVAKLYFVDLVRFNSVCKSWRQLNIHGLRTLDKLPWIMTWFCDPTQNGRLNSIFKFSDPVYRKSYTMKHQIIQKDAKNLDSAKICASNHGWLLLSSQYKCTNSFFFYSPFTKEIIQLPDLPSPLKIATFSPSPASRDCVFFAVHEPHGDKISISTCRCGDERWSTRIIGGMFGMSVEDVIYSEGSFYCAFGCGMLGAFNVNNQNWSFLADSTPSWNYSKSTHLFQFDGQLFMAKLNYFKRWHIFRFDSSQMAWVDEKSLGDGALFIGRTSFLVSAVGDAKNYGDKIYCHKSGVESICYSLKEDGRGECSETYEWVCKGWLDRIWIQPSCLNF